MRCIADQCRQGRDACPARHICAELVASGPAAEIPAVDPPDLVPEAWAVACAAGVMAMAAVAWLAHLAFPFVAHLL